MSRVRSLVACRYTDKGRQWMLGSQVGMRVGGEGWWCGFRIWDKIQARGRQTYDRTDDTFVQRLPRTRRMVSETSSKLLHQAGKMLVQILGQCRRPQGRRTQVRGPHRALTFIALNFERAADHAARKHIRIQWDAVVQEAFHLLRHVGEVNPVRRWFVFERCFENELVEGIRYHFRNVI